MKLARFVLSCALLVLAAAPSALAEAMHMATPKVCRIDEVRTAAMLVAPYEEFDQAMSGELSWRPLIDQGCYQAVAEIVDRYLDRNERRLTPEQISTMNFHVGQALAMAGKDDASVTWFEKSRDAHVDEEWLAYVDATLAFLRKDAGALATARAAYNAAAHRDPLRLRVIDGFTACLAKTYMDALMCAPA